MRETVKFRQEGRLEKIILVGSYFSWHLDKSAPRAVT
jgi:hypothetical protein